MASIADGSDRSVSIGRVFNRAFATIGAQPLTMFGIAFLFGALPGMVLNPRMLAVAALNLSFNAATVAIFTGVALLNVAFVFVAQGALVRATVAQADGQPVTFADCAVAGLRKIVPLLVLGLVVGIGVTIGLVLLLVPGIILYLVWSVAAPVLVEERVGIFGALGRSSALTRGARWPVLAIELIALLMYWLVSVVSASVTLLLFSGRGFSVAGRAMAPIAFSLSHAIGATIMLTLVAAIQTSLYVELRDWKDGTPTRALGDIFA